MPACSRRWSIALALAATLLAAEGIAAADDGRRVEERLPSEAKPPTDSAPATKLADLDISYAAFAPFVFKALTIDGMTAVPLPEAESCSSDLIGRTVGPIELISLTQCMTRLYRDRGLFLSRVVVPPQEVASGVLRVRAIEGHIAAVVPMGIDQAEADAQFADALAQRPADLATFERALLLLADRYGHRVTTSQLAPDPNDPARYTFNLTVEITPVAWRLYGDNRGTDAAGPAQAFAWVAWNSPFGAPDRLLVSLFTTPADTHELLYAEAAYAHGWARGLVWSELGASVSRSRDGTLPVAIATRNDVERLYGRITVSILRSRSQSLWAALGFDARDTKELMPPATTVDESTRVLRGSLSYALVDGATRVDLYLEGSHGLDTLGASSNRDAGLTHADARPQFTKVRLYASLLHKFSDRWEILVMAAGQLADGALVSSEEFGGGGARFGRAYDYSEISGDHAAAAAAELRWNWKRPVAFLANLQLYAFADVVNVWEAGDPLLLPDADLSSAGLGIRLSVLPGIVATVEGAKPLTRDVASEGDRSPRAFFSLAIGW